MLDIFKEDEPYEAKMARFREAATTGDFPSLLREDYKDILLSAYATVPATLFPLCYKADSNKETETYRGLTDLGPTTAVVPEGGEFPERMLSEKSIVTITNYKYGDIVSYTREMELYNKLAEFKRLTELQGRALADGLEENIADYIETTTNTTAYSATVTLNRVNLEAMVMTFKKQTTTDTEGKTIRLGLIPDTLLIPPDLEMEAQRLLNSALIPGSANNDVNVLKGSLDIVVSHRLSSASLFYVCKRNWPNGLTYQKVIGPPPETFVQNVSSAQISDNVFRYDKISYRADMIYGIGNLDDKWCIRSTT